MRSLATRDAGSEISEALPDAIAACKAAGFDLIVVETSGIGQGDAAIVPLVDLSLYVMTPEFGAASQLEKIDMLDFADFVAINKFDRQGAADALRDVRKQYQRNRERFKEAPDAMPVFGTIAVALQRRRRHRALPGARADALAAEGTEARARERCRRSRRASRPARTSIVPPARVRYLAEIAETLRGYHRWAEAQAKLARERQQLAESKRMLGETTRHEKALLRSGSVADTEAAQALESAVTSSQTRARRPDRRAREGARPAREEAARDVAADEGGLRGRRVRREDPRQGDPHGAQVRCRSRAPRCRRSRCRATRTTARSCASSCWRTCPAASPSPAACSRSSARTRTRRACSPARATPSAPTSASTWSPTACRPSACRPRSTR